MTFLRRRRPDDWASDHDRARVLSAISVNEQLPAADVAWLADHIADCEPCAERVAAYAQDHAALRALRDVPPEPPRDLWARTAAAIEREAARSAGRGPAWFRLGSRRVGPVPLAAASGLLVVAVVVGVTFVGRTPPQTAVLPTPPPATPAPEATPAPTPLAIPPTQVAWVQANASGTYDLVVAAFDRVCGFDAGAVCAPIDPDDGPSVELVRAPDSVVLSPTEPQVVVVDAAATSTGGAVFIVPVPTPIPSGSPEPTPEPTPVPTPSPTTSPTAEPTDDPTATPSATPDLTPEPTPAPTPSPIAEGATAIITDVVVVGEAAYSDDGRWFAFSARPADGSAGPDIYIWQAGDALARPLTDDHRSIFAGWLGDLVLGSRAVEIGVVIDEFEPTPSPAPTDPPTVSPEPSPSPSIAPVFDGIAFVADPATAAMRDVEGSFWLPAVDPTGRLVVHWEGTLTLDPSGVGWSLGDGQIVVDAWAMPERPEPVDPSPEPGDPSDDESPAPLASATPAPSGTLDPFATPDPLATPGPALVRTVIATGPIADFDARWDPTGTRLAIWIADPADPRLGALRLFVVDAVTGVLTPSGDRLDGAPALRGFSLERDRLAWVTPPGQDGEGSRVHVVAWSEDSFGTVESRPGEGLIVGR